MPAFGMQWMGVGQCSPRKRTASRMSSGPVEQLRPMTSTLSASSVASAAETSGPRSILRPLGARAGDVAAQQHLAAVGEQRDRGLDRHLAAGRLERLADAEDRGLDLENVL